MSAGPETFEGGLVVEGGAVTGAWIVDRQGLAEPIRFPVGMRSLHVGGRLGIRALARRTRATADGTEIPATMSEVARGVADDDARRQFTAGNANANGPSRSFCRFLGYVDHLSALAAGTAGEPMDGRFARRCADAATDVADARASLTRALAAAGPFLATLDPFARADADPYMDDEAYAAMDRSFDPAAPLAGLAARLPGLRGCAVSLWRTEGLDGSASDADIAKRLAWKLSDDKGPAPEGKVAALRAMAARFHAMPRRDGRMVREHCRAEDPVRVLGHALLALPRAWEPRTGADWMAFARCQAPVRFAMGSSVVPDISRLVGGKGRWEEHLATLLAVDPANVDAGKVSMTPVRDMATAFGHQVVRPAMPGMARINAVLAAHALLFSGRSVHRMLRMARDWHARQGLVEAAMPPPSAGRASLAAGAWLAGFPDAEVGGVSVRVLTRPAELAAEGAPGVDATGMAGLHHCVSTYAPTCRRGKARILGLRTKAPGGTRRLSTAEVSTGPGWTLVQHRGRRNDPPPAEAVVAVETYLAMCRDGTLPVDVDGFRAVQGSGGAAEDAGYDIGIPGATRAVFDAWAPLLPHYLRRAGLDGLPGLAADAKPEDGKWWRPPADTRGGRAA